MLSKNLSSSWNEKDFIELLFTRKEKTTLQLSVRNGKRLLRTEKESIII